MHVGWTFLLATAIYLALPNFKLRGMAYVIPLAMFSATVVTGNHWFLDAVLGLMVALCGLGIALVMRRYLEARRASSTATTPESSS
jgi:membrane-associated phospholipid phosphatase